MERRMSGMASIEAGASVLARIVAKGRVGDILRGGIYTENSGREGSIVCVEYSPLEACRCVGQ